MILVLGGAGFIGSHVAKTLRNAGEPHLVFDNLERGHRAAISDSPFVLGDLRQPADLARVFAEFPIETVMHFAAFIEVGESVRDPARYYWNNLYGVLVLLEQMRQHGVGQIVFSSTAAVYGEPERVPIPEEHPTRPTNPYGETKLAVERLLHWFGIAYGLRSVSLRYFNAAGADPDGELGEDHRPETHLIPLAIASALGRRESLSLFGDDYDTPDGTCIRDYVHVMDLAEAHLLAAKWLREGGASVALNLGNGQGYSVREVIRTVEEVSGRPVPVTRAPRRPGDPARLVASSEAAQRLLGWNPRRPDLRTIVEDAYRWFAAHPHGYGSAGEP